MCRLKPTTAGNRGRSIKKQPVYSTIKRVKNRLKAIVIDAVVLLAVML